MRLGYSACSANFISKARQTQTLHGETCGAGLLTAAQFTMLGGAFPLTRGNVPPGSMGSLWSTSVSGSVSRSSSMGYGPNCAQAHIDQGRRNESSSPKPVNQGNSGPWVFP